MQSNGKMEGINLLDFVQKEYDFNYIVDPLLVAGGIGLVHGKGGHGKTQWAFSLADAISSGTPFLGRYDVCQGPVLYIQVDMPEPIFNERWQMALPKMKAPENIIVVPYKPIDVLTTAYRKQLSELVDEHRPRLVVIDTLRKIHVEDENDNAVPMQVYAAIREAVGPNAATLIIHHDRKSIYIPRNMKKDSEPDDDHEASEEFIETFRGARAWIDDCDLGTHLYKYGKSNRVKMSWSKLRCKPQESMFLRLNDETLLIEPKPPESAREWAWEIQKNNPGIEVSDWTKLVQERAGCGRSRAYEVVNQVIVEMNP